MIEKLSKAEARNLFEENAVLIGNKDCIPVRTAKELLGAEIVNATMKLDGAAGRYYNVRDDDGCNFCQYLTEAGFFMAITLYNIKLWGGPIERSKGQIVIENNEQTVEEPHYIKYWDAWSRRPSAISKDKKYRLLQRLKGYYASQGIKPPANNSPAMYLFFGFTAGIDFAFEEFVDDIDCLEEYSKYINRDISRIDEHATFID